MPAVQRKTIALHSVSNSISISMVFSPRRDAPNANHAVGDRLARLRFADNVQRVEPRVRFVLNEAPGAARLPPRDLEPRMRRDAA